MTPLYRRVLGERFARLPAAVRALHDHASPVTYAGRGSVERGGHPLARLVGWAMRFPPAMQDVPVRVRFDIADGSETWTRDFGGHTFTSTLTAHDGRLVERFPLTRVAFELDAGDTGLAMHPVAWWALGVIPVPRALAPAITAREREREGRFAFEVEASLPWMGRVVRYTGWLVPA